MWNVTGVSLHKTETRTWGEDEQEHWGHFVESGEAAESGGEAPVKPDTRWNLGLDACNGWEDRTVWFGTNDWMPSLSGTQVWKYFQAETTKDNDWFQNLDNILHLQCSY